MSTDWNLGIEGLWGDERSALLCLELDVDEEGMFCTDIGKTTDSLTIARLDQDAVLALAKRLLYIVDCNVLKSNTNTEVDLQDWLTTLRTKGFAEYRSN